MIGRIAAIAGLLFLTTGAAPADWTKVVRPTPEGGRLVGNPAARVKLVEFASYTCPHCAHFAAEGSAPLAKAIRTGRLAVELRPIVFDQLGFAATVVSRCAPIGRFWTVNEALYAKQDQWYRQAQTYLASAAAPAQRTAGDQLRDVAVNGGIAATAGLTAAQANACFADPKLLADTARSADAAGQIARSTPTFMIGNQKFDGLTWATLSTKLRAAGLN